MHMLLAAVLWAAQAGTPADLVRIDWSHVAERRAELASVRSEYVAAINAQDSAAATSLYRDDAVAIFGDADVLRGRSAMGARLQERFRSLAARVTLTPRSFAVSQDLGSETGTFMLAGDGAGDTTSDGSYVTIYSRQADGRWRIAMEVRTANGKW